MKSDRRKKNRTGFLGLSLATFFYAVSAGAASPRQIISFCGQHYDVEVVKTEASRSKGLMDRDKVEAGHGMLFIFRNPQALNFWMKNVNIPLDIAYFDSKGKFVKAHLMKAESRMLMDQQRAQYLSEKPAQFALEAAAGSFTQRPVAELMKCRLQPLPKIDSSVE
jgi:uncharacterized membrane protein (UPF0127 family)